MKNKYQKFKEHLKFGGIIYALERGKKYFFYLIKKQRGVLRESKESMISKGKIKILSSRCGINIFWNGSEITKGAGLNTAINVSGLWITSAGADWEILEKDNDYIRLKVIFKNLPLTQVFVLKIEDENNIQWWVDMEVREQLCLDEIRAVCLIKPCHKSWICDYQQADFPRPDSHWRDLYMGGHPASLVGARFPIEGETFPSFVLEAKENKFLPFIQNSPLNINSHTVGFRYSDSENGKNYAPGRYQVFAGKIILFEEDYLLDKKIEGLRRNCLEETLREKIENRKQQGKIKVLLVNLPWHKGGKIGVRAGSRWPHIKTAMEESYSPFPFFLAYAAALLKNEGFEIRLIDALAERMSVSSFMKMVLDEKPDLLVAETSTPSLINDLKLLNRLPDEISVALCGPEANIRDPIFLSQNKSIDYVFVGEYEFTLLDLVERLSGNRDLKGILGLIYRDESGVRINSPRPLAADLDVLPWPLRDGLPMSKYNDTPGGIPSPSAQMWASRGCPYQCLFCLWPQLMYQKSKYRVRSVVDVVNEMEYLVRDKGFRSVYFDDDTFNVGKLRMLEFAQEIRSRKLDVPWAMMARADLLDEQILESLKGAGLCAVKYGVESAEQSLVDNVNKNMDLGRVESIINFSKSLGIKTHLTFTFGLPGETARTIKKTIDFAVRMNPDSTQFSITTAFPGTQYFQNLDEKGYITSRNFTDYDGNSKGVFRTDALQPGELENAKRMADRIWQMHILRTRHIRLRPKDYWSKAWKGITRDNSRIFISKLSMFIRCKLYELRIKAVQPVFKRKQSVMISNLVKFRKYVFCKGVHHACRKAGHSYLDMFGVFHGSYAFKGPDCVQIDLTSNCNNNCIGCWCNSPLLGSRVYKGVKKYEALPTTLVHDLINELSGLGTKELYFSGGGEPFMHPDLLQIVEHANHLGLVCSVNTNFTLISEDTVKRLIDLKIDNLTVSVWAGSPVTYVATHPSKSEADFNRIYDMLCMLNTLKKNSKPRIKIYNVISNINYHELGKMVEFAKDTKSEAIEFTVIDTIPNATDKLVLSKQERGLTLAQCERIKRQCNGVQLLNLEHFMRRLSDQGSDKAQYDSSFIETMPCYIGWLFARIMPNGDVNSCLKSHRIPVGNIYEKSFREIWNSKEQRYFRRMTLQRQKNDSFFALIGNDPNCKVGCFKGCDDIGRNLHMHNLIAALSSWESRLLKTASKIRR